MLLRAFFGKHLFVPIQNLIYMEKRASPNARAINFLLQFVRVPNTNIILPFDGNHRTTNLNVDVIVTGVLYLAFARKTYILCVYHL